MAEAPPRPGAQPSSARERCIAVHVAGALYGLRVEEVQEVIGMRALTRAFHAPEALGGVMNLRGDVLAVLDLGVLLGRDASADSTHPDARIVVVREPRGARRRAGLRVDGLAGLRDLPEEGLEATPSTASDEVKALVDGVIPSAPACSVLSVSAILDAPVLAPLAGGGDRDD